jgi:hypothetical protein
MRVRRGWERVHVFGRLVLWFARRLAMGVDAMNIGSARLNVSLIVSKGEERRTKSRVVRFT